MPQEDAHIYRDTNGILGGVCCGVAEYFDLDVALVRLLTIVLTTLSAGAFAFIYLAIWLILPAQAAQADTLDVDPAAFRSEVYEQVVNGVPAQTHAVHTSISPVPPAAASAYYQNATPDSRVAPAPQAGSVYAAQQKAVQHTAKPLTTWLALALIVVSVGAVVFSHILGFVRVDAGAWFTQAGPFLLIALGLFIMGRGAKSDILILCAGFVLVIFIIIGAFFGLHEGPLELGTALPFSPDSMMVRR